MSKVFSNIEKYYMQNSHERAKILLKTAYKTGKKAKTQNLLPVRF